MTKEEKQRGLELQGYINSIRDMTIKEIAIKYLKKYHLPKFLAGLLVKFSTPLLLAKDYELRELEKENAELKETITKMNNVITETFSKLTNAKEIIKKLKALYFSPVVTKDDVKRQDEILSEAEQFLEGGGKKE